MDRILDKALGDDGTTLAATEKQLLLSRLLGRLAHEIRNPLSSLDIHVQLLEEDLSLLAPDLRPKLDGRLEIVRGELHRLENVVKQFLRLAGPSALELDSVSVEKILKQVCDLLKPELERRKISLALEIQPGLPTFLADVSQFTQALLNVMINAVQAVDERGRIEICAEKNAEFLRIAISDTGPGIPPDKMSAIFEPYYTTKQDGNGLGLWIAQQIAFAHRGSIQVANLPERGAVFSFLLPLTSAQS